jgi:hypothetical protein
MAAVRCSSRMFRRVLAKVARALDLARIFDLPPGHPHRMIAAQVVLYVGLGIVIAVALYRKLVLGER